MTALNDLLNEMKLATKELLSNAQELLELSKHVDDTKELRPLQTEQEKIISQLISLDEAIQKECPSKKERQELPLWEEIQSDLEEFEDYNQAFITQLRVKKSIIQFELNDLRKSKQQLSAMKNSYGATSGKKKSRRGLNKIS